MALEYSFSMIKPDAVKRNICGKIICEIESNGFEIIKIRKIKMSKEQADEFYSSLKGKPFFEQLCNYMSSGEIYAMVLAKENAIMDFRELIGDTDPLKARIGTIRRKYGISKGENTIHGSDSEESARREISFFVL